MTEHITTPVKRFIKALRKFDPNCPVDDRGDEYYTRCPVHGGTDHDSMSFCEGEHGQLLVHCHSQGCSFDEIMHAVGLKPRHGFTQGSWKSCDDKPNIVRQRRKRLGISPSASKRPASPGKEANVVPPKIGVPVYYDYTDRRGVIVGRVVKIPLTDSNGQQVKKEIYQQRRVKDRFANTLKAGWFKPRGANLYEWVAGPSESEPSPDSILESERARFPIYRLPETLEEVKMGETIFVVEGEKDVDTARALGLCATTNPGGAGKWRKDHSESLQGASQVVFIPDNDEAGFDHVDAVARSLSSIVDEIRIVELPDLDDKQDLTDWVDQGGDVIQLIDLVDAARPFEEHANDEYQIIDAVPERLKRPLAIVNGRSYLFSRVPVGNSVGTTHAEVVVDEDDTVYGSVPMTGARKLGDLPFEIDMPCDINPSRFISPMGLRKLAAGEEVDPGEVFERIVESVKAFIDLDRSIASETTMARLVALMVMQTYFLGAFAKIGYGWIQGPIGSGKSSLLQFMTKIAYLGQFLTASSTHASLRDLAAAGAVLGIDDCNSLTDPRLRPEIHSLLLSGNSRGAMTTLKVAKGNNGWQTVWIPAFGFRFFTATVAPDPVLASRSIQIPLVPTNDFKKAGRDPETMDDWPHDPKTISDDLWILGVRHLTAVEFAYSRTISSALLGRAFDPWRPLLAVATYLDVACPNQYQGLFDEIHDLAVNYQESRQDFAVDDPPRILVKALWSLRPPNSGAKTTRPRTRSEDFCPSTDSPTGSARIDPRSEWSDVITFFGSLMRSV
jgi:hypothetical protein